MTYRRSVREFLGRRIFGIRPIQALVSFARACIQNLMVFACLAAWDSTVLVAQPVLVWPDSMLTLTLPDVVVTATRGPRRRIDVPIPTTVISRDEALVQGALRISDLLSEQTDLQIVHGLGSGIQVQGLDAAYTLVLVDGQPVIGRNGGTLDLDRLPVGDVERVEIVQGPSSSLYGSEALAGVINLITKTPDLGTEVLVRLHYETHETADLTASAEWRNDRYDARLLINRFSTGGYDLSPELLGLTSPGFVDYNTKMRLSMAIDSTTSVRLDVRFATQDQTSTTGVSRDGVLLEYDEHAERRDWSVAPQLEHQLSATTKIKARAYATGHRTDWFLRDRGAFGGSEGATFFDHLYGKGDVQFDAILGSAHLFAAGGGVAREQVRADRVHGDRRAATNTFGFVQHEWWPAATVDVIASARLDVHSDYAARLSPKLAMLFRPADAVRIRASIGSGFKAPTFQQLYMDFTNPIAGYSVIGATDVAEALAEMEELGQIRSVLADPEAFGAVRPETSVSYGLGLALDKGDVAALSVSLFRNDVRDLIETLPIAIKTNGQQVFSYLNLDRINTQGAQIDLSIAPRWADVRFSFGYQYLQARDRDVLDALDAGKLYKRVNGRDRRVRPDEYGGLFDRSKHSGSIRFVYRHATSGFSASIRGLFRGRYGYGDLNGNLVLDDHTEFVPGYALWHVTLTQPIGQYVSAQAGVRNLLDYTDADLIPSLPGRLWFAGARFNIH